MKQRASNSSKTAYVEYDDGRTKDETAIKVITQSWIDNHMIEREDEFTKSKEMTVFCATWNVNAKKQEDTLDEWLLSSNQQSYADVYAIGFQEIVDLNAMNVALDGSKTQSRAQFWQDKVLETLCNNGNRFNVVMNKALVGLLLIVIVKDTVYPFVKDVRAATLGVGLMGVLGNKGGVCIRMSLHDSAICFITAHLAAHRENVSGRNSDYKNIIQRILFTSDFGNNKINYDYEDNEVKINNNANVTVNNYYENSSLKIGRPQRGAALTQGKDLTILEHDIVFFFGDFNYRIDEELSKEQIFALSESSESDWMSLSGEKGVVYLRKYDQLNQERKKGTAFQVFQEADIFFRPTYKFQPGTDVYDKRPEKKLRAPAWCDRILWYEKKQKTVKNINYKSCKLLPSDHKPVSGQYIIEVKDIITDKEIKVFNELKQKLENNYHGGVIPQVEIFGENMNFTQVKYNIKSTKIITIKNNGKTLAHWHFINKLEESRVCKKWITIETQSGLLLPNEAIDIQIHVLIDCKTSQAINLGKENLDDVIILRIENCNDFYVNCKVEYLRSCYGMSLEELVYTLKPVRNTPLPAIDIVNGTNTYSNTINETNTTPPVLTIPKELWRLVDALWTGDALKEKDLFAVEADSTELASVRESLDTNTEFPSCTPHAIAEAITTFLSALPSPLLPPKIYPKSSIEQTDMKRLAREFLEQLPPLNYTVFVYMIAFFREVLVQHEYNRSTPAKIAELCLDCMTYFPTPNATSTTVNASDTNNSTTQITAEIDRAKLDVNSIITYFLTATSI